MSAKQCSNNGCDREHLARGLCRNCYDRARHAGDLDSHKRHHYPDSEAHSLKAKILERSELVDRGHGTPCLEWQGATAHNGYGKVKWEGKQYLTHRALSEAYFGPFVRHLDVDHCCANKICCNVNHLQAVTHAQNVRRGGDPHMDARDEPVGLCFEFPHGMPEGAFN